MPCSLFTSLCCCYCGLQALSESQAEATALHAELRAARARGSWSPGAAAFEALERKIQALEAAAAAKSAAGASLGSPARGADAQPAVVLQLLQQQQQYEAMLAAKNAELEGFRQQVEALLVAAKQLQRH